MNEENKRDYSLEQQTEFGSKLWFISDVAAKTLSRVGWFLLMSAICKMGEPTKTVFPKLSHGLRSIEELGPTYKKSLAQLPESEQEQIQGFYRKFTDSLSYGYPDHNALRD
jgi:hypothetical protein